MLATASKRVGTVVTKDWKTCEMLIENIGGNIYHVKPVLITHTLQVPISQQYINLSGKKNKTEKLILDQNK